MKSFLWLWCLLLNLVFAGDPGFTFYDSTNGLPSNDVRSLAKDSLGNLWVGTLEGAAMYDGSGWTVIDTNDGLPFKVVHSIMADRDNRIWFGTFLHGVTVYNGTTFTTYGRGDGLLDTMEFSCITQDSAGRIWIGGMEGISVFDGAEWTGYDSDDGLDGVARAIVFDGDGTPWAATSRGIYRLSYGTEWGRPMWGLIDDVRGLLVTGPDTMWYGGHYSFCKFHEYDFWQCGDNKLVGTGASDIVADRNGDIWFRKGGRILDGEPEIYPGLTKFDGTDWHTYDTRNGMPTDRISAFLTTREGTMYAGTHDRGVFIFEEYPVPLTAVRPELSDTRQVGDTLFITWLADTALVESVNIAMSVDTGRNWTRINDTPVACETRAYGNHLGRLCRYHYLLPGSLSVAGRMVSAVSNHCRIKIIDAADDSVYSPGDERFIIRPAPRMEYIQIFCTPSPNHIQANDTVRCIVEVYDGDDNIIYQPVETVWGISDRQVISDDGIFVADGQAGGTVTIWVTVALHGVTLTDSISVTVPEEIPDPAPFDIYRSMAVGDELVYTVDYEGYFFTRNHEIYKKVVDKYYSGDSLVIALSCSLHYTQCSKPCTSYAYTKKIYITGDTLLYSNVLARPESLRLNMSHLYAGIDTITDSTSFFHHQNNDHPSFRVYLRYGGRCGTEPEGVDNYNDEDDDCCYLAPEFWYDYYVKFYRNIGLYSLHTATAGPHTWDDYNAHLTYAKIGDSTFQYEGNNWVGIDVYGTPHNDGIWMMDVSAGKVFDLNGRPVGHMERNGIYFIVDEKSKAVQLISHIRR